jgi:phospholipid/cholesterol/gamma-HCH transport system permease protein
LTTSGDGEAPRARTGGTATLERAGGVPPFDVRQDGDTTRLGVSGRIDLRRDSKAWVRARRALASGSGDVVIDLSNARLDDGVLALLLALRQELEARSRKVVIEGADVVARRLIDLRLQRLARATPPIDRNLGRSFLARIGFQAHATLANLRGAVVYVGAIAAAAFAALLRPSTLNWRDLPRLIARIGADALPIVIAINFLVGTTLAYMGAIQLEQFGANIFVADMVAIAVVRALGPLMTAIVIAGRSGAGIAAELGTMKVSEEIDALRTLGLDPIRFLVLPRILALMIAFPLLTIVAEIAAMAGGLLIGTMQLGLTADVYIDRTRDLLTYRHFIAGMSTAVCFGLAIALISCHRGLATEGGAEGVGLATTRSVVQIIFQIVVIQALFTVFFNLFGI